MVAVGQEELARLQRSLEREEEDGGGGGDGEDDSECPRVLNKLTLCFYPGVQVPFHVSNITGKSSLVMRVGERGSPHPPALPRGF